VLQEAGLVMVRAEGTRRLYSVEPHGIEALRSWLDGFWDEALTAFKAAAEREAVKERKP
jgi:DNA-binding PadR family transcriptional regulator